MRDLSIIVAFSWDRSIRVVPIFRAKNLEDPILTKSFAPPENFLKNSAKKRFQVFPFLETFVQKNCIFGARFLLKSLRVGRPKMDGIK